MPRERGVKAVKKRNRVQIHKRTWNDKQLAWEGITNHKRMRRYCKWPKNRILSMRRWSCTHPRILSCVLLGYFPPKLPPPACPAPFAWEEMLYAFVRCWPFAVVLRVDALVNLFDKVKKAATDTQCIQMLGFLFAQNCFTPKQKLFPTLCA